MEDEFKTTLQLNGVDIDIGTLYSIPGRKEMISFEYSEDFLSSPDFINIDPLLSKARGRQYPPADKNNFGFIEDVSPDRWGRNLLKKKIGRAPSNIEATILTSDSMRLGGIRIWDSNGEPLSKDPSIPTLKNIRELQNLARKAEEFDTDIQELYGPGSSLGGARPKAGIMDAGKLKIAKFPKKDDVINIEAWESVMLKLCEDCEGITTVPHRIINNKELSRHATLILDRFDRNNNGDRIPYMSAMTALGYSDGTDDGSYLEIADFITQYGDVNDAKELWKRMVFSMLTSNFDDHLRNHGFLLADGKWRLSPVFDVNPAYDKNFHSLSSDGDSYDANIENAIGICGFFYLDEIAATQWIENTAKLISEKMEKYSKLNGISTSEYDEVTKNMLVFSLDDFGLEPK
ncbi:HipA domain-containing protein [Thiomicrorhabdus sp. 6S2-11]|uniref:HipA domain-containing protein n=1 Tax=Thiomicrorhabdus marina TaxID=2818442 RepID=A0ABS3Q5I4_9GAMM|nr:HipA domain-containing protein [Thiomicrorhabdus marina]MBO1927574.1 HipA domain-containing protein [Thiomicrorhabdus marina]